MNKGLYMVYDRLANSVIGQIVLAESHGSATRDFHDALGNKDSQLSKHPADYDLLFIGFLTTSGVIEERSLETVAQGSAWKAFQDEQAKRLRLEA